MNYCLLLEEAIYKTVKKLLETYFTTSEYSSNSTEILLCCVFKSQELSFFINMIRMNDCTFIVQRENQGIKTYCDYCKSPLEMEKDFELQREPFVYEVISHLTGLSQQS